MPKKLIYRPLLIDKLVTNQRISSYQNVFCPANDQELMGVYLWNSHITGMLYPLVSTAEISLRNAIDHALTAHIGRFWWSGNRLRYRSLSEGTQAPFSVLAVRDNFARARKLFTAEKRRRYRTYPIDADHHGVMAKTEFSTWEFIFDHEFMGDNLIWPKCLGHVFSGTWPNRSASALLMHVRRLVSRIREMRNRLSHHEPVWKKFGILTTDDALNHLRETIGQIEELLALVHPENRHLLEKSGLLRAARRACTLHEIKRFQHRTRRYEVRTTERLHRLMRLCMTDDRIVTTHHPLLSNGSFLISAF